MSHSQSDQNQSSEAPLDPPPIPINWDNIHRGVAEKEFRGEVPVFWKGIDEPVDPQEVFEKAWDQFQEFSYSDLLRLAERLEERIEETRDVIYRKGGDFLVPVDELPEYEEEDPPDMADYQCAFEKQAEEQEEDLLWLYRAFTFYYRRKQAATALARYIEEKGSPPKWENLSDQEHDTIESAVGQIQPRHEIRVRAVLENLDPNATAEQIFQDAQDQLLADGEDTVDTSQLRKKIKDALEKHHDLTEHLDAVNLCKLTPREAERIGIQAKKHISEEAERFADFG